MHSVVTEDEDKEEEEKIILALSWCGYPSWTLKQVKDKVVNKQISKKKDNDNKTKCLVVIPYVEGLSQKAKRIFKKHGVTTATKPNTTLRKLLVYPKDKWDLLSTTDYIYEIPCKKCKYTDLYR